MYHNSHNNIHFIINVGLIIYKVILLCDTARERVAIGLFRYVENCAVYDDDSGTRNVCLMLKINIDDDRIGARIECYYTLSGLSMRLRRETHLTIENCPFLAIVMPD